MNTAEIEQQTTMVELLAPNGLGFGKGGISVKTQLETGILTPEAPGHIHEVIMHDPALFKPVEVADDGCGDGRPWTKIIQAITNLHGDQEIRSYKRSLLRAKVFGGGLVAGASMLRAIVGAPHENETVADDRQIIAEQFAAREFAHGAHTDNHATGTHCGCGAIDKYPEITANALYFREQIKSVLGVIYGETFDDNKEAIEQVFSVYESLADNTTYFAGTTGEQSMSRILASGAVVKELYGHHVEDTIIINDVEGTTLDQQYYTQIVKDRCAEKPETVQAFTVDTWRGRIIADTVAKIAIEIDPTIDEAAARNRALADFLIRTLAVAGTLTAGDLPVYRHRGAEGEQ